MVSSNNLIAFTETPDEYSFTLTNNNPNYVGLYSYRLRFYLENYVVPGVATPGEDLTLPTGYAKVSGTCQTYSGSPLDNASNSEVPSTGPKECASRCRDESTCKAFEYSLNSMGCTLKKSSLTLRVGPDPTRYCYHKFAE